jgi:hypothetical protein
MNTRWAGRHGSSTFKATKFVQPNRSSGKILAEQTNVPDKKIGTTKEGKK